MEAHISIVAYKPKESKAEILYQLIRDHYPILKKEGLVSDREAIIMEAKDGTIIEVFEWKSDAAIEQAHTNPAVIKMWGAFAEACDFIPVGQVEESANVFSGFKPFQ